MEYLDKLFVLRDTYEAVGFIEEADSMETEIKRHMEV